MKKLSAVKKHCEGRYYLECEFYEERWKDDKRTCDCHFRARTPDDWDLEKIRAVLRRGGGRANDLLVAVSRLDRRHRIRRRADIEVRRA